MTEHRAVERTAVEVLQHSSEYRMRQAWIEKRPVE
jgi:hypothetical protein